jgi:hypothetical protein
MIRGSRPDQKSARQVGKFIYLDKVTQNLSEHLRANQDVDPYKKQAAHGMQGLVVLRVAITPSGKL